MGFRIFFSPSKVDFYDLLAQNNVIAKVTSAELFMNCFMAQVFFSLADNDTDISKTHLNKAEQIIKVDFYLRLQNTENFALSASRSLQLLEQF